MDSMIKALETETENLVTRHRHEMQRAQRMLEEALAHGGGGTHLSHNLASVVAEIGELAARLDQTEIILRDLRARREAK